MNKRELPTFKYHPDPVTSRSFVKETIICEVCNEESEYNYDGPFYSVDDVESICPWCIKDGKAAEKFNGDFIDDFGCEKVDENVDKNELFYRTPSFYGLQSEEWLSHCGDFCAYHGYLNGDELKQLYIESKEEQNELYKAIDKHFKSLLHDWEDIIDAGIYFRVFIFKCLTCGTIRVYESCL